MKNKKRILLGAAALAASCSVLAACGSTGGDNTTTTTTESATTEAATETTTSAETTTTSASEETTSSAESGTTETKEISDKNLVGSWASREYNGSYIYTFNEDGTGNYDAAGKQMPFTLTIDGDKLSMLFEGDTDPFETTYKIDGNTLTTKDSLGEDVLYDKK